MRQSHLGCLLGVIGISLFSAALALVTRQEWRFSLWTFLLMAVGPGVMFVGARIWLLWFSETHGQTHVPTRLGFFVLAGLLAAFLLSVLYQGLSR